MLDFPLGLFDLQGIASGWVTDVGCVVSGLSQIINGRFLPILYRAADSQGGVEGNRGLDVLCEAWEVKALMAAVELQRHADGTASVTLRSSEEEKRFEDMVVLSSASESRK